MLRSLKDRIYQNQQLALDTRAAIELSKLGLPYLSWPGSAIAPSGLITVLNDIDINSRTTVLEYGSGISTLYIAKILQKHGGKLVSIDQDEGWSNIVRSWIEDAQLEDVASLVVAPLTQCSHAVGNLSWYDEEVVANAIIGRSIDCILVDGPTAYESGKELARYPALPVTYELMSERCSIFLDDINRPGEKEIVKRWSDSFELSFVLLKGRGGLAYAVRGQAFYAGF